MKLLLYVLFRSQLPNGFRVNSVSCGFNKRLKAGVLLLRLPNPIITIDCKGNRIYLGTAQDSFMYMKYKPSDNQFYIFADDIANRFVALFIDCSVIKDNPNCAQR